MDPYASCSTFNSSHPIPQHIHREQQQAQLSYTSTTSSELSPPPPPPIEDAPPASKAPIRIKIKTRPQPIAPPQPTEPSAEYSDDPDAEGEDDIESDEPEGDDELPSHPTHPPPQMTRSTRQGSNRGRPAESESEFEAEEEIQEDSASQSEEEDDAPPQRRSAVTKTKKSHRRVNEWDESDEDEYEEQEERRAEARRDRHFVEQDEEEFEDEDGRPIKPQRKIRAFPPRKSKAQDSSPGYAAERPTRAAAAKGKGRASTVESNTSHGVRRSSRAANIPPEDFDEADGGDDFDGGAAAFVEPAVNGADGEGEEETVETPSQPIYKDISNSDDEDAPINTGRRSMSRGSTLTGSSKPAPRQTRNSLRRVQFPEAEDSEEGSFAGPRKLRERKSRPNYVLQPPSSELNETRQSKNGGGGGSRRGPPKGYNHIPWGASGKELDRHLGLPPPGGGDDSSDDNRATPRKGAPANMFGGALGGAGGGLYGGVPPPLDMGTGPSNMGKVGDSALADADPLGVNTKVTFDSVGGLDTHIQQLKEMVSLPLLYPELFLRFKVTPPRGVLFHGPPGTGKTLVARALAASCSTGGTKISFFMRKGADCLSKWVGEAERQLRLLFEEARACQPSIIFFDEIDGLAPVRSSKQDQIHASIVSTLLALMDGMDGRGQVIVIGATNRPDSVDPALRRPGRFDREFYFPLPNKVARRKILDIHTGGWEPALGDAFLDNLAGITKGYGGADLRALCTEASLNAIQRRYPQIYKTNDRLLLEPESISVQAKDFMISVKNLIPSSARATASAAAPLPTQLVPLLSDSLELATKAIDKALPPIKKRNVLEEAEWENDDPNEGSFEKEMMLQSLESLRVYRPRVLIYGEPGSGQSYIGAAVLHHLEGFHVQSLDIGTLMGDSTRSIEAAIVQLFVEAKRHKPSVLYIPSLSQWAHSMSEMARSTVKALLDSLAPSDPVMLLAVVDGTLDTLPRDVKAWFGYSKENRVALQMSTEDQRATFFAELLANVSKPPNQFPDAVPKRRRVLEVLPIAPALPVRGPSPAELAAQLTHDATVREHIKIRLGPILKELHRKHKRGLRSAEDHLDMYHQHVEGLELEAAQDAADRAASADLNAAGPSTLSNGVNGHLSSEAMAIDLDGADHRVQPAAVAVQLPPRPHDVDLEKMQFTLWYDRYLTVESFLEDLYRIVQNAERDFNDTDRLIKAKTMLNQANLLIDSAIDVGFRQECQKMAAREMKREKERKAEKGKGKEKEKVAPSERHSARVAGEQPEVGVTDPVALARALKRQREGSLAARAGGDAEAEGELPPLKRPRADGQAEAGPSGTTAAGGDVEMADENTARINSTELTALGSSQSTVIPATSPAAGSPLVPTLPGTPTPSNTISTTPAAEPIERPATPPPPPPPFVLPEAEFAQLSDLVATRTAKLNVEQLEQLRAMLLDVVWRRRAEWERSGMVDEMREVMEDYVGEVEADEEEREWAD